MKTRIKQLWLCAIMMCVSFGASAHDFEVDGIYYNITSAQKRTVAVTFRGKNPDSYNEYKGSVTIPETVIYNSTTYIVTTIGLYAFEYCSSLTSVTIGNRVTEIGYYAFNYCTGLTSVTIPNSVTSIDVSAFQNCTSLTSITIPNSVTSIGGSTFCRCTQLKIIDIRNSVIGSSMFDGCTGLTSITIPNSVTSIGNKAFYGCTQLVSIDIRNSVIGNGMFAGCSRLTSVTIPNSVTSIGNEAFQGCTGLTSVTIPNSVATIGENAFSGCSSLTMTMIGDNVKFIGSSAFPTSTSLYANRGTTSLLALWNANYRTPYEMNTENVLTASSLSVETTQMTATVNVNDFYPEFENTLNNNIIDEAENVLRVRPEYKEKLTLRVTKDDVTYTPASVTYTTQSISPSIEQTMGSASSLTAIASYIEGDAQVTSQMLTINDVTVEGDSLYLNGLKPGTSYTATYTIKVDDEYEYKKTVNLQTDALTFVNAQPRVVSEGNIVVSSTSNLDVEETNVGFQWRRTDWSDDFESKSAGAYLYEGTIEGYIRSLNTNYLWKFRPYYQSADGSYFYGDWTGMDPTDVSYFEPTVHTYAKATVEGNAVEVKGYAQRGTDNIVSQGFAYWRTSAATSPRAKAQSVPSTAQRVEASGTVMEANLTNLDYETTYCYVAYVTTSEGETFYGEEKTFTIGAAPTGIINVNDNLNQKIQGVYDLSGRKVNVNVNDNVNNSKLKSGIYIKNGKKVLIQR